MDKLKIIGGTPLRGQIRISGAKNAALPLLTASLLTDEKLTLSNVPHLADIDSMLCLLEQHGVEVQQGKTLQLKARNITNTTASYEDVRKMRASILVLGPLLTRCGQAKVSIPGGCAIGARPVDLHIQGLIAMGADIEIDNGYIVASAPNGLRGTDFTFSTVSVTGTENLLMAATLAKGTTRLINAALEPEVVDLANCLNSMGAEITGIGTNVLVIEGVNKLTGTQHRVIPDRIEIGTYAIASAITGGDVELLGANLDLLPTFFPTLYNMGVAFEATDRGVRVCAPVDRPQATEVATAPYPGFPTDLQAQTMALTCIATGESQIVENIFENRFMHVPELGRMGANIALNGQVAFIQGVKSLKGAEVMATDLRASVSLVLAGLAAEGETIINRIYHLDRGYERLEEKLAACGAQVERIAALKAA